MPLLEYKCNACGHRFERIVKFSDPPLKSCPQCGKEAVEQLITAPAIQFKGSGWYVSDYARKSGGTAASGTASANPDGGGAAEAKDSGGAKEGDGKKDAPSAPASGSAEKSSGSGSGSSGGSSGGDK